MKYIKYFFILLLGFYLALVCLDISYSNQLKKLPLFSGEVQEWNKIEKGKTNPQLAIFGSSRAFIQINPYILENNLKLKTYNFGLNGSKFKMQFYRFKLYLKNNTKPKIVVWNLDTFSFSHIDSVFQPNQYAPFILSNFKLYNTIKEYKDTHFLDFILPLYRYRDQKYWNDQIKRSKKEKLNKQGCFRNNGFKSYDREWNVNWKKLKHKPSNFSQTDYLLLNQLIKLCQKNNIQLIFILSPEYYKGQLYMTNRQQIIRQYKSTISKYNLPFIDYSQDSISNQKKYFYNTTHMNYKGANAFSLKLAKDLKSFL